MLLILGIILICAIPICVWGSFFIGWSRSKKANAKIADMLKSNPGRLLLADVFGNMLEADGSLLIYTTPSGITSISIKALPNIEMTKNCIKIPCDGISIGFVSLAPGVVTSVSQNIEFQFDYVYNRNKDKIDTANKIVDHILRMIA